VSSVTRREMPKTERAARDAMKPYVRDGLISQAEANKVLRKGLTLVESVVRDNYSPDQTLYYAGKVAAAREAFDAQDNPVVRVILRGKLMGWEMYAAVYAVVREEHGDTDIPTGLAEEVVTTVRETAREARETYRVLIERHHPRGGMIGAGVRVVSAADKDEAARIAVAESVDFRREQNAKARAEMARTGQTWPLPSEDPKDFVVKNVRRAPRRKAATV